VIPCARANSGAAVKCACAVKHIAHSAYAPPSFPAPAPAHAKHSNEYPTTCNPHDEHFDGSPLGVRSTSASARPITSHTSRANATRGPRRFAVPRPRAAFTQLRLPFPRVAPAPLAPVCVVVDVVFALFASIPLSSVPLRARGTRASVAIAATPRQHVPRLSRASSSRDARRPRAPGRASRIARAVDSPARARAVVRRAGVARRRVARAVEVCGDDGAVSVRHVSARAPELASPSRRI
jgi:hypothetical protein